MLTDSHCHLDYYSDAELPEILARAAAAGVGTLVTIGTTMDQSRAILARARGHANVWCTVGVHPHHAAEAPLPSPEEIIALVADPKVIGIGESGLDWFYKEPSREIQEQNFRIHIRAAQEAGVPLVIHARNADEDIERVLTEELETRGPFDFLLHCFSSGRRLAEFAITRGGYVSFSGILTFPKSQAIRDIARDLPADRLLVETDAPYLAPVPLRGKRNEPAFVTHTAAMLAEVRGLAPEGLADLTSANFRRLFRKAA
ncbi:MAG TPA: TatD family hydrolase [Acetobacteraceae bacterium]|jgi:TatD DNase family protein|nr:TatD family hydrolase [Acetobacteraceae bacterium]